MNTIIITGYKPEDLCLLHEDGNKGNVPEFIKCYQGEILNRLKIKENVKLNKKEMPGFGKGLFAGGGITVGECIGLYCGELCYDHKYKTSVYKIRIPYNCGKGYCINGDKNCNCSVMQHLPLMPFTPYELMYIKEYIIKHISDNSERCKDISKLKIILDKIHNGIDSADAMVLKNSDIKFDFVTNGLLEKIDEIATQNVELRWQEVVIKSVHCDYLCVAPVFFATREIYGGHLIGWDYGKCFWENLGENYMLFSKNGNSIIESNFNRKVSSNRSLSKTIISLLGCLLVAHILHNLVNHIVLSIFCNTVGDSLGQTSSVGYTCIS